MAVFAPDPDYVKIVVFDGDALSDSALQRLARGVHDVVEVSPPHASGEFAARWRAAGGASDAIPGGTADDLRGAVLAAADHQAVVVATPMPTAHLAAVSAAIQGAAQSVEKGLPAVGVHFMREEFTPGAVGVLSQTGAASGYSALFGAAFASAHGLPLARVLTEVGVARRRHADALDQAIDLLEGDEGMPTIETDDPVGYASSGGYAIAIHAILDVADKHRLLRPDELKIAPDTHPNASAVIRMMDEFPGDVVAVLDAVRLLHGEHKALHTVAAVAAGVSVLVGVSAMTTQPAAAASLAPSVPAVAPAAAATLTVEVTGPSTLRVTNPTDQAVTVVAHLEGQHGHGGTTYDAGTRTLPQVGAHVSGATVQLQEFTHDWGHNLYAVQYDFVVDGHVVLVVKTPGGVATTGTTVAQPIPGVVIPTPETTDEPVPVMTPEPDQPTPMATPTQVPHQAPDTPQATPGATPTPTTTPLAPHATPTQVPHQVPDTPHATPGATPQATPTPTTTPLAPQAQPTQVPHQVPDTPHATPGATPQATPTPTTTPLAPHATPLQVPHQVPQATPGATPQAVPELATPIPTGVTVPDVGQTTVATTGGNETPRPPTSTPIPGEPGTTDGTSTVTPASATHQGSQEHPTPDNSPSVTSSPDAPQSPGDTHAPSTASGLAHTGPESVGLMAGLTAALLSAGAGVAIAENRRRKGTGESEATS